MMRTNPGSTPPVMLVTGSTDGIGRETALELARRGVQVLVHGRRPERAAALSEAILNAGGQASPLVADLASLRQVRELASAVLALTPRLDVLINNAGVYQDRRQLTEDGLESTFAVNHLAHFLLTLELLDLLRRSTPARVITVSSMVHASARMDFDNLQGERHYEGFDAYARSKLANLLFARALARRLEGTGVTSNALHPGVVATKLLRSGFSGGGVSPREGAVTSVYLATAPAIATVTGAYFVNRREMPPSTTAQDEELGERLWAVSEGLVK